MCIQTDLNESLNLLFVALVKQLTATDVLTNYWIIETVKDGYLLSRNLESTRLTFSSLHDVVRFLCTIYKTPQPIMNNFLKRFENV